MPRNKSSLGALALLLIGSAAHAQEAPRGRTGNRIRLELLRSPEVRKELAVSDDQTKAIEQALAPLLEPSGVTRGAQTLSAEERQKRFEQLSQQRAAASKLAAEEIDQILDHQQSTRLKQLWLQRLGAAALIQPEVVEDLSLTHASFFGY